MKILLIGSGGRESALGWKIYNSHSFKNTNSKLYCAPGNPFLADLSECINIKAEDISSLVKFAVENEIDLVVVGPEVPLSMGLADELEKKGLKVFGPSQSAAEIESSKIFAKNLMQKYGIPTAAFRTFDENTKDEAKNYLKSLKYPVVIKADGLASGKGVIIAENYDDAAATIKEFTEDKIFKEAGSKFVIEEFLTGQEASIFAITDGENFAALPPAQDHKKIFDGDKGKNTGGMGAFAPAYKFVTPEVLEKVKTKILQPTIDALAKEGRKFKGCLFCGLMITPEGEPYVIEFNCRFGDPETQVILPLVRSDFLEMLLASANGTIKDYDLELLEDFGVCVVMASDGYPDKYETSKKISGIDKTSEDCLVFHAGTKAENGDLLTSGGRVLNVVCYSDTLKDAIELCYENVNKINFENMYFRKDIGKKGL